MLRDYGVSCVTSFISEDGCTSRSWRFMCDFIYIRGRLDFEIVAFRTVKRHLYPRKAMLRDCCVSCIKPYISEENYASGCGVSCVTSLIAFRV